MTTVDYFGEIRELWELLSEIQFTKRWMRRSCAALTDEDIRDMDNGGLNETARLMGNGWWRTHQLPKGWKLHKVDQFEIIQWDVKSWQGWFSDDQLNGRMIPPGTYFSLIEHGAFEDQYGLTRNIRTWMSDTPAEMLEHWSIIELAQGNVLVTGLGIGWTAWQLCEKDEVEHVTVIELEPKIVELVKPNLQQYIDAGKLSIVIADAKQYKFARHVRFDWAWHDIWPTIDMFGEDAAEMNILREHWLRHVEWQKQLCWSEEYVQCVSCNMPYDQCECCSECHAPEGQCIC